MGPVQLVERCPVPGVCFGVVGRVVGHRESVVGGIELDGVVDSGVSERAFQQPGLPGRISGVTSQPGFTVTSTATGPRQSSGSPTFLNHNNVPTCDTLVRTRPLVDAVENVAQVIGPLSQVLLVAEMT